MSSAKSPLQFEISPSRVLNATLGLAHGLALLAIQFSPLVAGYRWLLAGLVGLSWLYYWLRFGCQSPWFVRLVRTTPTAVWWLQTAAGQDIEARLLRYYLHPHVIVLWFGLGTWRRCSVILLADNIGADHLRRMRVALLNASETFEARRNGPG